MTKNMPWDAARVASRRPLHKPVSFIGRAPKPPAAQDIIAKRNEELRAIYAHQEVLRSVAGRAGMIQWLDPHNTFVPPSK
jgi:hypothetical protein